MPRNPKNKQGEAPQGNPLNVFPGTNPRVPRPRKRKMPKYAKITFALLVVCLLSSFVIESYHIWQVKREIGQLKEQQRVLLQQQNALEKELISLQNPEIIEKFARESLGMVKPGEIFVVPAVPEENIPVPKNINPGNP